MLRGTTTFRCTECKDTFRGPDIEWQATALSTPIPCPKCGSKHTLPVLALKRMYEGIWKTMDENK